MVTIGKVRGKVMTLDTGGSVLVTIHPSYLLRLQEERDKKTEYARFLADLKVARDFIGSAA